MFDVDIIRQDFPVLQQKVNGKPLVYLDSTATSQKPLSVIQAMDEFYRAYYANVHRGIYQLSEKASAAYEEARRKVARFINARSWREVIFTRNATWCTPGMRSMLITCVAGSGRLVASWPNGSAAVPSAIVQPRPT
mgnify:CR=1 FL=1